MTRVTVKNGSLDMALNRVPSEKRKREYYDKPGIRRREAKKAGIKNAQKRNRANKANRD